MRHTDASYPHYALTDQSEPPEGFSVRGESVGADGWRKIAISPTNPDSW